MDHDSPKCVSLTGTFSHRDMVDLVISFGTLGCMEFVDVQIATWFWIVMFMSVGYHGNKKET